MPALKTAAEAVNVTGGFFYMVEGVREEEIINVHLADPVREHHSDAVIGEDLGVIPPWTVRDHDGKVRQHVLYVPR